MQSETHRSPTRASPCARLLLLASGSAKSRPQWKSTAPAPARAEWRSCVSLWRIRCTASQMIHAHEMAMRPASKKDGDILDLPMAIGVVFVSGFVRYMDGKEGQGLRRQDRVQNGPRLTRRRGNQRQCLQPVSAESWLPRRAWNATLRCAFRRNVRPYWKRAEVRRRKSSAYLEYKWAHGCVQPGDPKRVGLPGTISVTSFVHQRQHLIGRGKITDGSGQVVVWSVFAADDAADRRQDATEIDARSPFR